MTEVAAEQQTDTPRISRMHCHATDPNPITRRTKPGARCGLFLGYAPGQLAFRELGARAPSEPDGRVWIKCAKCKAWNVFEIVPPK